MYTGEGRDAHMYITGVDKHGLDIRSVDKSSPGINPPDKSSPRK